MPDQSRTSEEAKKEKREPEGPDVVAFYSWASAPRSFVAHVPMAWGRKTLAPLIISIRCRWLLSIRSHRSMLTLCLGNRMIQAGIAILFVVKIFYGDSRYPVFSHLFISIERNGRICYFWVCRRHVLLSFLGFELEQTARRWNQKVIGDSSVEGGQSIKVGSARSRWARDIWG